MSNETILTIVSIGLAIAISIMLPMLRCKDKQIRELCEALSSSHPIHTDRHSFIHELNKLEASCCILIATSYPEKHPQAILLKIQIQSCRHMVMTNNLIDASKNIQTFKEKLQDL